MTPRVDSAPPRPPAGPRSRFPPPPSFPPRVSAPVSRPAISVENLGKAYRIGLADEASDSLLGAAARFLMAPARNLSNLRKLNVRDADGDDPDVVWALRDVSFDVQPGEVVGVIGRNGAGKSTLLKILSRITEPTSGHAVIRGRVSSLLEVGTGFHPDLSGRDNVYMNGTILGMTKREIDAKFDEIAAFSGVEKFLDTPIKKYSSGMKVRLAFSVAAHLEPEILIIDEVLAVGDAEFQAKCLGKMQDVAGQGRTVLFVSHNMAAVTTLCERGLHLCKGRLTFAGEVSDAIDDYSRSGGSVRGLAELDEHVAERSGTGVVRMVLAETVCDANCRTEVLPVGGRLRIRVTMRGGDRDRAVVLAIGIYTRSGFCLTKANGRVAADAVFTVPAGGTETAEVILLDSPLGPGSYQLNLGVLDADTLQVLDHISRVLAFDVPSTDIYGTGRRVTDAGTLVMPLEWRHGKRKFAVPASGSSMAFGRSSPLKSTGHS